MPPFNFNEFVDSRMYNDLDIEKRDLLEILVTAINRYSASGMWIVVNMYIYNFDGTMQELRVWKSESKYYIVGVGECSNPYKLYYEAFTVRRDVALFDIDSLLTEGYNVEEVAREDLARVLHEKYLRGCVSKEVIEAEKSAESVVENGSYFTHANLESQSVSMAEGPLEKCVDLLASNYDNLKSSRAIETSDYYTILERASILVLSRGEREHVCIVTGSEPCIYTVTIVKETIVESFCARSANEVKSIIDRLVKEGFRLQLN